MRKSLNTFWLVVAVASLLTGCETPKPKTRKKADPKTDASKLLSRTLETEAATLVSTVEKLRDREFRQSPGWRAQSGPLEPPSPGLEDQSAAEAALLGHLLFGIEQSTPAVPTDGLEKLAYHDPETGQIVFLEDPPSERKLELAVVAALVDALGTQHFDFDPGADQFDMRLARSAATRGDDLLVAAAYLASDDGRRTETLEQLAHQPVRSLSIAPLGGFLRRAHATSDDPVDTHRELADRLATFQLREGMSLAAAFYRSNGWSGAELLHSFAPTSTADVVRPDRWMRGRAIGDWTWPAESPLANREGVDRKGRVGPAMIAVWLSQKFRPELARTVYSGWRSDAYRYATFPSNEGDAWRFEWLTQWNSPSSARQIAGGFEKLLAAHYETSGDDEPNYTVVRKGLKVGVAVESAATPADVDWPDDVTYLTSARVQYHPREPLPTSFEPTRTQRFRRAASEADIDDETWNDPATNLSVKLHDVSHWKTRRSRTLPLRWFAKYEKWVLQMTTELANPFGPKFGSDAYVTNLEEAFSSSLANSTFESQGLTDDPLPGSAIRFSATGKKNEKAWRLEAWHLRYGDIISTISLQGPADSFGRRLERARNVVSSVETIGEPPGSASRDSDSKEGGSIEYEIESQR